MLVLVGNEVTFPPSVATPVPFPVAAYLARLILLFDKADPGYFTRLLLYELKEDPKSWKELIQRIWTENILYAPLGVLGFAVVCCGLEIWKQFSGVKGSIGCIIREDVDPHDFLPPIQNTFEQKYSLRFKTMIEKREWYRIVTSHFMHGGPLHLLNNMRGTFRYGGSYERRYGTMRLVEATVWAILLGSIPLILLIFVFPSIRRFDASILGFSEVLYFWMVVGKLSVLETASFKQTFDGIEWMIGWDVYEILVRNNIGSAFHLLGFLNGYVYMKWIRPHCSLPTEWLAKIENVLDAIIEFVCFSLGLSGEDEGPYVVESAPV